MGTPVSPEIEAVLTLQTAVIHEISGPAAARHRCERLLPAKRRLCRGRVRRSGEVPGWSGILEAFYLAGDNLDGASKASFVEDGALEFSFDDEGLTVYGAVDVGSSESVVAAEIVYGVVDDSDGSVSSSARSRPRLRPSTMDRVRSLPSMT